MVVVGGGRWTVGGGRWEVGEGGAGHAQVSDDTDGGEDASDEEGLGQIRDALLMALDHNLLALRQVAEQRHEHTPSTAARHGYGWTGERGGAADRTESVGGRARGARGSHTW